MRRRRILVLILVVLCLAGCGGRPLPTRSASANASPPRLTGFGAAVPDWDVAHREDRRRNLIAGCCFDPMKVPGVVYGDRYFLASPLDGRMLSYEMNLVPTSSAFARRVALRELPPDARVVSFTVHGRVFKPGSCAILILSSARLGRALVGVKGTVKQRRGVGVELLSGADENSYNPMAVNNLILQSLVLVGSSTQEC